METQLLTKIPQKTHRNDLLKLVALITMLIDHIGYLYFPEEMLYRTIGRIAFPIFAYQIALGFKKTSSRSGYAKRLLIFALISQIPYLWFNPELYFDFHNLNIMFTFLLSLGVLQLLEFSKDAWIHFISLLKKTPEIINPSPINSGLKSVFLSLLTIGLILLPDYSSMTFGIGLEYGTTGVLFVLLFYICGNRMMPLLFGYIALSGVGAYISAARWFHYSSGKTLWDSFLSFKSLWDIHIVYADSLSKLSGIFFQSRSVMAVPIIAFLNFIESQGQINFHLNKYVGYLFYPVHISVLLIIKWVIVNG